MPHCRDAFAYKVLHLCPAKQKRGTRTDVWVDYCTRAVGAMKGFIPDNALAMFEGPWQVQEVIFYAQRGKEDAATIQLRGVCRKDGRYCSLSGVEVNDILATRQFTLLETRHQQMHIANQEAAVLLEPLVIRKTVCSEKSFQRMKPIEQAIYSFQFAAFRKSQRPSQPKLQTAPLLELNEGSEAASAPASTLIAVDSQVASSSENQFGPAPASSLISELLSGETGSLPVADAGQGPKRPKQFVARLRYATNRIAIFVSDDSANAHVTKFFQNSVGHLETFCSCVLRSVGIARKPIPNSSAAGPVPSTCDHVVALRRDANDVLEHCMKLDAEDSSSDLGRETLAIDDRYVVQHQEGRVWSLLIEGEVYIVTQLRKDGFVCKTCNSKCGHASIIAQGVRGEGNQFGSSEMEKLPWLVCEGNVFRCPSAFSSYVSRITPLLQEDRTIDDDDQDGAVNYEDIIACNLRQTRATLKGEATRPCACGKNEITTVPVEAIIFDKRGVWSVNLEHQVSLRMSFRFDVKDQQMCLVCKDVVDDIDEKHELWFYRKPTQATVQHGITTRLAFHFLDRVVNWGTTFSQLMDALFVNGIQGKRRIPVGSDGRGGFHIAGVKFFYNLEMFQQVWLANVF